MSGRARYTYSKMQPLGCGCGEASGTGRRRSSIAISSPGSTSRTKVAPTMSSAAVSLATTQPRASRPSTSGRKPCGSRAAYRVCSSMNTSEKAPRTRGSVAMAAGLDAAVSGCRRAARRTGRSARRCRRWPGPARPVALPATARPARAVLIRLPLWPRARLAVGVARKVGCAFSHTEAPLVEYRQWPTAMCPRSVFSDRLVEDLRDQAHVLVDDDPVAVADRYPGRLLAAVLERVQAEVGELGDFLVRGPDAEHAAGVPGRVVGGIEIIVSVGHPA